MYLSNPFFFYLHFYFFLFFSSFRRNENDDVNDIFPKLSAYLQLASNSALKGAPSHQKPSNGTNNNSSPILDIKTSPPSSPTEVTKMIVATPISTAANTTTAAATTSTTTTTASNTANKISLVPTNILMKPTTTQSQTNATPTAQFSFKPQQFLCAKASASGTPTVYTTTNGGVPMKVLLVNTLQKPTSTAATTISGAVTSTTTAASLTARPVVSIQSKTHQTSHPVIQSSYQTRSATANANAAASTVKTNQPTVSTNKYLYSGHTNPESPTRRPLQWKYQKATPGFRNLLNQLVQLQNRNLEISKQRLDVEKQRLEFEQSTGEKILNVLTALLQPKSE